MRLPSLALLVAVVGPLSAAPVPKKDDKPPPKNYFPVAVGMRWEYQSEFNGRLVCHSHTVTGVEEKDGVKSVTFQYESDVQPKVSRVAVRVRVEKNEVTLTGKADLELKTPIHMGRRTFATGDKWEAVAIDGSAVIEYEVGKPEELTVPAGRFTALPVTERVKGTTVGMTKWYADGVGEVKSENKGRKAELKAFDQGGKAK